MRLCELLCGLSVLADVSGTGRGRSACVWERVRAGEPTWEAEAEPCAVPCAVPWAVPYVVPEPKADREGEAEGEAANAGETDPAA